MTRGYRELQIKRLQGVTEGFRGLQEVTWDYGGYNVLQGVTRGYRGSQGATESYKRVQGITGG